MPRKDEGGEAEGRAEVLLEFLLVGAALKVTAIDPESGEEVSIVGDPARGREVLADIAIAKLRRVQARRRSWRPVRRSGGDRRGGAPDDGPGIVV